MNYQVLARFVDDGNPERKLRALIALREIALHADALSFRKMENGQQFVALEDQPRTIADRVDNVLRQAGYETELLPIARPAWIPRRLVRLQWMLFGALLLLLLQLGLEYLSNL